MLCSFRDFARLPPDFLRAAFADGTFRLGCEKAAAIVLTSWSVYPYMTDCWKFLQEETLAGLTNRPRIFLDLADPASRQPQTLHAMMDVLAGFEKIGPTTLSLNGNEANRLALALGLQEAKDPDDDFQRLAGELRTRAGIDEVGIHLLNAAIGARKDSACLVHGPHCQRPRKSVGGGDRFNAGWLAGYLLGFEPLERLLLAAATSGFFVRAARSGTLQEIAAFIRRWAAGQQDENPKAFA